MSWPPGLIEMDRKAMTSSLFPPFARELDCVLRLDLKCRRKGVIPPRSRRRQRLRLPPGAAEFLEGGFVTYTPEQKCAALKLDPLLIETHGAVSAEVADARARGALECSRADIAVSVTGVGRSRMKGAILWALGSKLRR
jgi:Competence-damaged protein